MHKIRAMEITIYKEAGEFTLLINGINFHELDDAPAREREPLARSTTKINMNGHKK